MSTAPQAPGPAPAVPLNTVPLAKAKEMLEKSRRYGTTIRTTNHPDYYFVSSHSRPGFWHATSLTHCDCEGHAHHGLCYHRIVVSWHLHQQRKQKEADAIRAEAV